MTPAKLKTAVMEAERFLARAKALKRVYVDGARFGYSKETAAVRRASMDLTRALANLRRFEA